MTRSGNAACSTSSRRRRLSYARRESSRQHPRSTQARGLRTGGITGGGRRLHRHGGATETRSCGQRRVILRQKMIGTGALHQWTCAKNAFEPRVAVNGSAKRPSSCKLDGCGPTLQISSKEGEGWGRGGRRRAAGRLLPRHHAQLRRCKLSSTQMPCWAQLRRCCTVDSRRVGGAHAQRSTAQSQATPAQGAGPPHTHGRARVYQKPTRARGSLAAPTKGYPRGPVHNSSTHHRIPRLFGKRRRYKHN